MSPEFYIIADRPPHVMPCGFLSLRDAEEHAKRIAVETGGNVTIYKRVVEYVVTVERREEDGRG